MESKRLADLSKTLISLMPQPAGNCVLKNWDMDQALLAVWGKSPC